jgi:hypothetical protein
MITTRAKALERALGRANVLEKAKPKTKATIMRLIPTS